MRPARALTLIRTRSVGYITERLLRANARQAWAYRRTMQHLKPYPSAILFPESLMLLPCFPHTRRRCAWAVDIAITHARNVVTGVVGKIHKIEFTHLRSEFNATFKSAQAVVDADQNGVQFKIPIWQTAQRVDHFDEFYPCQNLDHFLPASLLYCHFPEQRFSLDALFGDKEDALKYEHNVVRYVWSWKTMPPTNNYLPTE